VIGDTIVAVATAAGPAERAVVRLSGPAARDAAARCFQPAIPAERATVEGHVTVRGASLDAFALHMPGPRSFTGEDVVELHVPSSPVLLRLLLDGLLHDGAVLGVREALPGEFTARACQNGRLGASEAEGLLLLLHAADRQQALAGVQWLRGGLGDAVRALRGELQDVLALLEVGLDFDEGDTGAVPRSQWLAPLGAARERLDRLLAGLPAGAPGGEVLLLGHSNAGKSSLANALAGRAQALVADVAGTTRDLLRVDVADGSGAVAHLWDAPGDLDEPGEADRAALALRERLAGRAASLLVVLDATAPRVPEAACTLPTPWFGVVLSKCDRVADPPPLPPAIVGRLPSPDRVWATSAVDGRGVDELRAALLRSARASTVDPGGPLRTALQAARDGVERAVGAAELGPELCAVELQAALRALDGVAGQHSPEDLLDRIYGRFCLGK